MSAVAESIITWGLGHKCKQCGSRNTIHSNYWIRGRDNTTALEYRDWGSYCKDCHKITWDKPTDKHLHTVPEGHESYDDKPASRVSLKDKTWASDVWKLVD